jgi:hypothetical protein
MIHLFDLDGLLSIGNSSFRGFKTIPNHEMSNSSIVLVAMYSFRFRT